MGRISCHKPFTELRSEAAAHCGPVITTDLIRWVMYVCDPNTRKEARSHEEMPTTGVVLMIVNGVVTTFAQDLAKFLHEIWKVTTAKTDIMKLCAQPNCFFVEDTAFTAGEQKIDLDATRYRP